MAEFLYVRAGEADVVTKVANMREAAFHASRRGFVARRVLVRRTPGDHKKLEVLPYDVADMPLWLFFGDRVAYETRALTDGERDLFEQELRYINRSTAEERLNDNIQDVAAALRALATPREGDMDKVQKRCFEFRHSGSDKFWTIEIVESKKTCFVTYGRSGRRARPR